MKCLFVLLALFPATFLAADWSPRLTGAATWNDNATNASRTSDRIGALQLFSDLDTSTRYSTGPDDALQPGLHLAAEWWPRFDALSSIAPGARLQWEHKFGLGARAPVISAGLGADYMAAHDRDRRGGAYVATFAARRRLSDTDNLSLREEFSDTDTQATVYRHRAAQTTIALDHDITEAWRGSVALFWREGDIVSYATPPRPDLVALARTRVPDDTFDRPLVAYSVHARTLGGRIDATRNLNDTSALSLSYEYRTSDHRSLHYANHLVSLSVVHQF